MAVRFRKSVKLGKGVRLNVGKSSVGLSVGGKHGGMSFNSKTGTKARTSLPGTGVSYITSVGGKSAKKGSSKQMKDFEEIAKEQVCVKAQSKNSPKEPPQKHPKSGAKKFMKIVLIVLAVISALLGLLLLFGDSFGDAILFFLIFAVCVFTSTKVDKSVDAQKAKKSASSPSSSSLGNVVEMRNNDAVDNRTVSYSAKPKVEGSQYKTYKVAGVTHYVDAIEALASPNPDYDLSKKEIIDEGLDDERIYEYIFYPGKVELVPEPDNKYDPKAIKVIIDSEHVGYIKAGSCAHLLKVINTGRVASVKADIYGGKYKEVYCDEDDEGNEHYTLEKDKSEYAIKLTVRELDE